MAFVKETELEKVKKVAEYMLMLDLQGRDGKFWPIIIQHPFFSSFAVMLRENGEMVNITEEDGLEKARNSYKLSIRKVNSVIDINHMVNKPYRLTFLKFSKEYLSKEDFSLLLRWNWIETENPNQDTNVSVATAAKWFREADKNILMKPEELQYYENLPETVRIYRGVSVGRNPKGLSWTDDLETARWFAHRFDMDGKSGYIQTACVPRSEILAYFSLEKELVARIRQFEILEK